MVLSIMQQGTHTYVVVRSHRIYVGTFWYFLGSSTHHVRSTSGVAPTHCNVRNVRGFLRTGVDTYFHDRGSFEVSISGTLLHCTARCGRGALGIDAGSIIK